MPKQFFELVDSRSSKYWHVDLKKKELKVTYGRIGTGGRVSTKKFSDAAKARQELEKLIAQKIKKGYQKVGASAGKNHVATSRKPGSKSSAKKSTRKKAPTKTKKSVAKKAVKKIAPKKRPGKKIPGTNKNESKPEPTRLDVKATLNLLKKKAQGAGETAVSYTHLTLPTKA